MSLRIVEITKFRIEFFKGVLSLFMHTNFSKPTLADAPATQEKN
jgi:hypothetical protein